MRFRRRRAPSPCGGGLGDTLAELLTKEPQADYVEVEPHVYRDVALPGGSIGDLELSQDRDVRWRDARGRQCSAHIVGGRVSSLRREGGR